ncbi:MAG: helix-turn-helix domain-containing protein [Bacteroidaceae bacterium]|nr:helix-turn-helix domain-containing protein [Bacteroidaceae bacterium]
MRETNIKKIGFGNIPEWIDFDYIDNDLIFYSDVKDLPFKDDVLKTNMVTIVVCLKGKIQMGINTTKYQIQHNEILLLLPNAYIRNVLLTPDFKCNILCLSQRVVIDFIPENKLWNKINMLSANPIIHIEDENFNIFELYIEVLRTKLRSPKSRYKKEVLYSIVRTCLYELLDNISIEDPVRKDFSRKEILFKNFIKLLSEQEIKHRNLTWYSNKLFVSPKHLSTVCKDVSGKTAFAWVNEYVVNDIKHLLLNSDKSIKEIADYYNFPNCSFFGKFIKGHTGYSPGEYRRILINDRNASQF